MNKVNPFVIPRNSIVEQVLQETEIKNNIQPLNNYLNILSNPYLEQLDINKKFIRASNLEENYQTFCGT